MSNYIKASKAVGKSRYDRKVSEYQSSLTKKNLDDLSASLLSFSEIVDRKEQSTQDFETGATLLKESGIEDFEIVEDTKEFNFGDPTTWGKQSGVIYNNMLYDRKSVAKLGNLFSQAPYDKKQAKHLVSNWEKVVSRRATNIKDFVRPETKKALEPVKDIQENVNSDSKEALNKKKFSFSNLPLNKKFSDVVSDSVSKVTSYLYDNIVRQVEENDNNIKTSHTQSKDEIKKHRPPEAKITTTGNPDFVDGDQEWVDKEFEKDEDKFNMTH